MGVKARTLEALIGALPGAAVGAATGAATYEPGTARIWLGPGGEVEGRPLTAEEKTSRRARAARGAALGAAAGAAGALGLGRGIERVNRRYDAQDAKAVGDIYLDAVRKRAAEYSNGVWYVPSTGPYSKGKADAAAQVMRDLDDVVRRAPGAASASRAGQVFGGPLAVVDKARKPVGPHPTNTARGAIHEQMRKLGLGGDAKANVQVYERLVGERIKTASLAYQDELTKLAAVLGSTGRAVRAPMGSASALKAPGAGIPKFTAKVVAQDFGSAVSKMTLPKPLVGSIGTTLRRAKGAASAVL